MPLKSVLIPSLIRVVGYLPLPLARSLGAAFGWLLFLLRVRAYRITRENIGLCFPQWERAKQKQLLRQSMIETGRFALETCVVWQNSDSRWLDRHLHKCHNEHLISEGVAQGQGLIVLAPHLGNWELLGRHVRRHGAVTNLYQPPKQAFLERLLLRVRQADGSVIVPTNARGVLQIVKALKAGGISGILPDQCPPSKSGEFAPFYGLPAMTMTLVHGLIQKTGCKVIFGVALRVREGFDIHYLEADSGLYSSDLNESLAALNRGVESCIALAPEQYQWEYKRFRKKHPDYPPRYQFKKR